MTTDTTKDHYYEDAQVRKATITVKNCNYRITATGANLYRLFVLGTFLPENETLTVPAGKDVVISSNVERHLGDLATKRHEVFIVNFAEEGSISGPCIYYIEEPDYTKEEMTEIVHSNIRKGRSAWLKFRLPIFLNVLAVYPLIKLLLTLVGNIEDEVVQQNVWMGLAIMIFFS